MAMPLRLIYNVKVSLKQKIGLVCVFGLCFVMIAFAIIRAKQVLVQQQFVNLTMLMIWSTLTAAICKCLPSTSLITKIADHLQAVIVGSLPALKVLITHRSSKQSQAGSAAGRGKQYYGYNSGARSRNVPLGSISSDKKRRTESSDSREEILSRQDSGQFVVVQHDIVSLTV